MTAEPIQGTIAVLWASLPAGVRDARQQIAEHLTDRREDADAGTYTLWSYPFEIVDIRSSPTMTNAMGVVAMWEIVVDWQVTGPLSQTGAGVL